MGELRAYSRAALTLPEDLAEDTAVQRLFVLIDPEYEAPEVTASGRGGEGCLWAYTSVEQLIESCGNAQPYATLTPPHLVELASAVDDVLLVAVDIRHPDGARYPEPDASELAPLDEMEPELDDNPLVWVPTRPVHEGDRQVSAELYGTQPGEKLLLVFDSREQAWQACGPYQPLAAVHANDLELIAQESGAQQVVTNGAISEGAQHQAPVRDWARQDRSSYFGFRQARMWEDED